MGWLCKLYSNNELKRDVYSQILNYAADIMKVARNANELAAFQRDFICKLQKPDNGIQVIKGKDHTEGKDCFDGIIAGLLGVINAQEPNDDDSTQESGDDGQTQGLDAGGQTQGADAGGQTQGTVGDVDPKFSPQIQDFWNRLWENCKAGYFRLIILCCGSPEGADGGRLRNLINLIYMSEKCSTTYDFIIMDFIDGEAAEKLLPLEAVEKSSQDSRLLRVIWRNYTYLPENPDVVTKRANNDKKLENALNDIKSKVNGYFWDEFLKELKQKFKKEIKEEIIDAGISGNNYTPKFRKKNKKTPETMYISIKATPKGNLEILRRQIRSNEKELYPRIKKKYEDIKGKYEEKASEWVVDESITTKSPWTENEFTITFRGESKSNTKNKESNQNIIEGPNFEVEYTLTGPEKSGSSDDADAAKEDKELYNKDNVQYDKNIEDAIADIFELYCKCPFKVIR